jgi:adenylosuccinate synthase
VPGWRSDLTQLRESSQVPQALTGYIEYLEQKMEIPITVVSVGPDRTQTIVREKSLA